MAAEALRRSAADPTLPESSLLARESPPRTLAEHLVAAGERAAGGLRFVDRREEATYLSWGELYRRARGVAAGLATLGLGPGERVALVLPTSPEFFDAFFGVLLAGAVPVPLYPPARLGRLDEYRRQTVRMIEASGARLVLVDRRVRRLLGEVVAAARPALGCSTPAELAVAPQAWSPASLAGGRGDDLALIQFSSGTTVDPKPVALSHRAVLAQLRVLNSGWPAQKDGLRHTGASWLPLYHDMGLIGCVFPAADLATDLTLIGPELFVARPAIWLRTLSRYRATVSPAPNFAYGLCVAKVRDDELAGVDLSTWRVALNGAEPVAPEVLRRFVERFRPWGFRPEALTPVYGLSEAALAVTFTPLERVFLTRRFATRALVEEGRAEPVGAPEGKRGVDRKAGEPTVDRAGAPAESVELVSVGRPLPGFSIEVRDAAGRALGEDRVGRVWARGPSLMEGYLERPRETARALVDGWLDTGDRGFVHDGELFLCGREKDILILRGRNYAPELVERAVSGLAGVRTGCVVAASWLPEEGEGEILALFVERSRDAAADAAADEELARSCRRAVLAATGLAVDLVVPLDPGTLPRTSSGKLRRGATVTRYRTGRLDPPGTVSALTVAGAVARSEWAFLKHRLRGG